MFDVSKSTMAKRAGLYGDTIEEGEERILIYGESGVGKTQLAAQWNRPVFMDVDRGENKYLSTHKIPRLFYPDDTNIFELLSADLQAIIAGRDYFDPDGGPYADRKTIVLDTVSKLNELLYFQAVDENSRLNVANDKAGFDEYGRLLRRHQIIGKYLKQIALKRGMAVIVTAWAKLEGDEQEKMTRDAKEAAQKSGFNKVRGMPSLVGAYRYQIAAEFTDVWFMERIAQGPTIRHVVWTQPHNGYYAKSRFALPPCIEIPPEGAYDKLIGLIGRTKPQEAPVA